MSNEQIKDRKVFRVSVVATLILIAAIFTTPIISAVAIPTSVMSASFAVGSYLLQKG